MWVQVVVDVDREGRGVRERGEMQELVTGDRATR